MRIQDEFDLYYEAANYLDSKAFKAYRASVVRAIAAAGEPITIRRLHAILGDAAKPEWTMDALEMASEVRSIGVLPTRYLVRSAPAKEPKRARFNSR